MIVALLACSPKAEVWVTPNATVVVTVDGAPWTSAATNAATAGSVAFPGEGSHTMRIVAADRPALVGDFETTTGESPQRSGFNEIAPSGTRDALRRRHPAAYLRTGNGPFNLPSSGQGVVLTVDANVSARVTVSCTHLPRETTTLDRYSNLVLGQVAETDPWVRELPAGDSCELSAGTDGRQSAAITFVVTPGEYRWLDAHLERASESPGGSWIR
jgi:hypothetical protein